MHELERKENLKKYAKWGAYGVLGIVVLAGAAYGISLLPKEPKQVHWHAKYRVYVDGQLVNMANPRFDGMKYGDAHIHAPEYDKIHNEGREGRGTLGKFFDFQLGGKFTDTELLIPQGASPAGDFKVNDTEKLRVVVSNQEENKTWSEIGGGFHDVSFHDGDRYIILYGNYTDTQISQAEAAFPDFNPKTTAG